MAHTRHDFDSLLRGLVKAIAGFEGKNIALVEEEFADQIGVAQSTFSHIYRGRVPLSPEAIKYMAKAGADRAYLSRAWGDKFLRAARAPYGAAEEWLDSIWPREPDRPTLPPRVLHNLPAPTYSIFVMRTVPYTAVLDGLRQRAAAVVVVSLGGMGKTSLAREIAGCCLRHSRQPSGHTDNLPRFDAAVWVGGQEQPGAMTLGVVLDVIANSLDYPGLSSLDPGRKRREVEHLLKGRRVLLIVDNFETVADDALLDWLLRLPEPSKALITTREYRREFQQGAWLVELSGMSEIEAEQFIATRALQINLKTPLGDEVQHQIITETGGNPKAIAMLMGLTKLTGRPQAAPSDDLLADLFSASWAALNQPARQVLLALTLFPTDVADAILAEVAGIDEQAFLDAILQLAELALVESVHDGQAPQVRRALHPLTRQFAEAQLADNAAFAEMARERWLVWAVAHVAQHGGYRPNQVEALQRALDREEPTLWAALAWAGDHGRYDEVVRLALGLEFYYYVRTLWGKKLALHDQYIAVARRLGNIEQEINALALHIQLLSRQGRPEAAAEYMARLRHLARRQLRGWPFFNIWHTQGLYHLAAGELDAAGRAWRRIIDQGAEMAVPEYTQVAIRHWLALCRYRQGEHTEARRLYQAALGQARERGSRRWVARIQIALALLDLDGGQIDAARDRLEESRAQTDEGDWEQQARLQQAQARLHAAEGNLPAARSSLRAAIDLFERMGLVSEIQAARAEHAALLEE